MSASGLSRLLSLPLLGLIKVYRVALSPWLGMNCRYEPSCSVYAQQALQKHGAWRGSILACKRIARCHPWGGSGYDPVPVAPDENRNVQPAFVPEVLDAVTLRKREDALTHAYGIVSRGNRQGGFARLDEYAKNEPQPVLVELWFFHRMLDWNLGDVPLFYAQALLGDLLDAGMDAAAMKVCLRCLQQNPDFRPRLDDVPRLRQAALRLGNDEVAAALPP